MNVNPVVFKRSWINTGLVKPEEFDEDIEDVEKYREWHSNYVRIKFGYKNQAFIETKFWRKRRRQEQRH